ncbi:Nose resistant to fluoxetine protein 6-like protein [Leptotrombidium deliense]|uniref:Nose resistant to fluoxetine protein 6-like protein n=1 Tax=Leptotrombidium deliense TaxID=299467 RepID=A0A443SU77_9ACAR|nr:Nose resistant to fluoxetine protein 6-like protein [Leptotrombidium deliense]
MNLIRICETLFVFCFVLCVSTTNAQTTEDDLEDFTFPPFTLHPIVDLLNKEQPEPEKNETSEEGGVGLFDSISVGSLFTKFLRRPKTNTTFNETHEDIYIRMSHMLDEEIEVMIKEVLPFIFEYQQDRVNITSYSAVMDSMGGMPSGLLEGTLADLGNFDQCVDARVSKDADFIGVNQILYSGSYCLVELEPPLPDIKDRLTYNTVVLNYTRTELEKTVNGQLMFTIIILIRFHLEFACLRHVVQKKLKKSCQTFYFRTVGKQYNITVKISSRCHYKDETYSTSFPTLELALVVLMVTFIAFASIHEYLSVKTQMKLQRKLANKLLHCFSIIKNTRKLFKSTKPKEDETENVVSLESLNGFKIIALIWLIVADVYLMGGLPLTNLIKNSYTDFKGRGANLAFQFILNSWSFSTEIFLFLSGLLVTYNTIKYLKNGGKLSLFKHLIYRWIRLTPTVIGILLITFLMFSPYSGSGPIFYRNANIITEKCYNNWWSNVFYLNNWFKIDDMCFEQMWILSAAFQMYVVAFFVLFFLYKRPVFGTILSVMLILIGVVVPAFVTFLHKLPPTFIINNPYIKQVKEDMELSFFPTYNHFSSYFIGVMIAFMLSKVQKVKSNAILDCMKWLLYIAVCLIPVLVTILWNDVHLSYPPLWMSVVYAGLHRIIWISGIAGITYQLVTKQDEALLFIETLIW